MSKLQLSNPKQKILAEDPTQVYVIGRLHGCHFVVQDTTVSRKHAEVFCRPAGWFVRDLGSKHGVWVNGVPVKTSRLKDGDELRLGDLALAVQVIREGAELKAAQEAPSPAAEPEAPAPAAQAPAENAVGGRHRISLPGLAELTPPGATTIMKRPIRPSEPAPPRNAPPGKP
jgi:pSer/pThr/pTyr-binding forkhead associated (FHA) protein